MSRDDPNKPLEFTDADQEVELDPEIEQAWFVEIQRRRKLLDAGLIKLIPWEEVEAEIFGPDE